MEAVVTALKIAGAAYVGLCAWLALRQSSYIYYPSKEIQLTPSSYRLNYEDVTISTEDGQKINAWYVSASPSRGTVLFCHGNGGNIGDRLSSVVMFNRLGFDVCMFDYRGYGKSSGKLSERGTYLDALAVWNYLIQKRNIPSERIVLFGESLGGAVAAWLATEQEPAALILDSTFSSVPDMAAALYPYLPVRLFCRFKYDTVNNVRKVKCPILVAHSVDDEMIPYKQGRRVFEAASEPKKFFQMHGSHNDDRAGEELFVKAVDDFLATYAVRKPDK